MGKVLSEAATVTVALESITGTAPSSGWIQLQPNPGGIQDWQPRLKTVERNPLSKYASREKGDNVGLDAEPKLVHDLTKELIDTFAGGMYRSVARHPGGTNQSFFRPTAVVDGGASPDEYTVSANGNLAAGILIYARGFSNAANNGLKVVVATSSATAIKVATGSLVAETPPANATLEVAGVQGETSDIAIDASGNLTSTSLDFSTLGLQVGMWIKIGGTAPNTFFATTTYNGWARITAIAANLLTLERRSWTVGSADNGSGKTIQLFLPRYFRNQSIDSDDYLTPTYHGELEDIGAAADNTVPTYTYVKGMALKTMELDAPLEDKIVCTASFVALDIPDPVLTASRVPGPGSAYAPLAAALIDTATDLEFVKLTDSSGNLVTEINSWKLTLEHSTKGRKAHGTFGSIDHTYGKYEPTVTMEAYFSDYDQIKALRDNRDMSWAACLVNHQVGLVFDLPYVALRGGSKTYAANEPVMISTEISGFRDPITNIVQSLSVFAHIPQ